MLSIRISVCGQDTLVRGPMLQVPLIDLPENLNNGFYYPSMKEASQWTSDLYDLSFWGIHELSSLVFRNRRDEPVFRVAGRGMEYLAGLAFSWYGSELPVPLGVWMHEAYHTSVLGTAGLKALNGNSVFHRWDGTVYGISDEELSALKSEDLSILLYSYVTGIQAEVYLSQMNTLNDFFYRREYYKNPLYLYNAWYVWNYFSFSLSPFSDSVKVIAPRFEDPDPALRDFAGADLTAWAYDMFSPDVPYTSRDAFPDGDGVNRRIGISDLSEQARNFLQKEKGLSLLNFVNPAVFLVNRIPISNDLDVFFFCQYFPTSFGHSVSLVLPVRYRDLKQYMVLRRYTNLEGSYPGLEYGLNGFHPFHLPLAADFQVGFWMQPANGGYFDAEAAPGGMISLRLSYPLTKSISITAGGRYKTAGWQPGEPYLDKKFSMDAGFSFTGRRQYIRVQ